MKLFAPRDFLWAGLLLVLLMLLVNMLAFLGTSYWKALLFEPRKGVEEGPPSDDGPQLELPPTRDRYY